MLSTQNLHAIGGGMDTETVRVVATPKAYEMIMNSLDNKKVQWAVKTAVSLALGKKARDNTDGHLIAGTYLSVWPRWAKSEEDESIIIISDKYVMGTFDKILPDCLPIDLA
jgi:hypothetical protein